MPIYEESLRSELLVQEIENELRAENPNFPVIRLVRGPYKYWEGDIKYIPDINTICIFIGHDLLKSFNIKEFKIFVLHALGHFQEGHLNMSPNVLFLDSFEEKILKEIKADAFAIKKKADKKVLVAMIKKLGFNEHEIKYRIQAISQAD